MEETLYQQSLRSLREIGEKTGEEMEEPVKILLKVEQILQEIEAHLTKEDPGQQNGGNERIKFVRDLCVFLMFGSDYVPLKARSAALSSTAREIETNEEKSKLPEVLVPVMKHMKYYLSLVDQAKKEVERLYKELTEKIEKAAKQNSPLSRKDKLDIDMRKIEMQAELTKWKNHIEKADTILTKFDNEVKAHQKDYNRKLKWGVGFAVTAATVLTGGIAAVASVAGGAVAALGGAATAGIVGGTTAGGLTLSIFGGALYGYNKATEREKLLKNECQELKSKLDNIKLEYEERKIDLKKLEEKIDKLNEDNKD